MSRSIETMPNTSTKIDTKDNKTDNGIGNEGACALGEALESNATLAALNMKSKQRQHK